MNRKEYPKIAFHITSLHLPKIAPMWGLNADCLISTWGAFNLLDGTELMIHGRPRPTYSVGCSDSSKQVSSNNASSTKDQITLEFNLKACDSNPQS